MKKQQVEIKEHVRGEMRLAGEVITYDLVPGPAPADVHPAVIDHLLAGGIAEKVSPQRKEGTR